MDQPVTGVGQSNGYAGREVIRQEVPGTTAIGPDAEE